MFALPAKSILSILEGSEPAKLSVQIHNQSRDFYVKNRNAIPKRDHILEALEVIAENLEIKLFAEELEKILVLFPAARIKLAVYEGCSDTEVQDLILESVFIYITGCKLPQNKDKVDSTRALAYLRSQAQEMGYIVDL